MRLNHNLASLNIFREQSKVVKDQAVRTNRLSSGYKVNRACEGPNAIAQSERQRIQIRGLQMAGRNAQDGVSMLQVAEGGLDSITSMLQRIRELSVQAGGVTDNQQKTVINEEIKQYISGIDDSVKSTEINGVHLLYDSSNLDNNNPNTLKMPSGANVGENIEIPVFNLSSSVIGSSDGTKHLSDIDVTSANGIDDALKIVDGAMDTVLSVRSKYGALQNRFERTFEITNSISDKIQGAESEIRDADIAEEMMLYAKNNILIEAGNAMMVQSNKFPQDVLRILENVRSR